MSASPRAAPGERTKTPSAKTPKCPICGKPAARDYRPFCGKRCADVDLGRWLGGRYAVPGEPVPREELGAEPEADAEPEAGDSPHPDR